MIRRAIAILALTTWAASGAAAQTAPVIDAQTGTVTISPQTLEWFRQRLAEEEERLRQLQVTVQQIARALPRLTEARTFVPRQGPAVPEPSDVPPATASVPVLGQPLPSTVGAPSVPGSVGRSLTMPGRDRRGAAATNGTQRPARIYVPTLDPRNGGLPGEGAVTIPPDTSGSPVGVDVVVPGGPQQPDAAPPDPGAGDERALGGQPVPTGGVASVTTEPSVVSLAPAPERLPRLRRMTTPAMEPVARRVKRAVAGDPDRRVTRARASKRSLPKRRTTAVLADRETIGETLTTGTSTGSSKVKRKKTWRHGRRYRAWRKAHGKRWAWRHHRSHRWARHTRSGRRITESAFRPGRREIRRTSSITTHSRFARVHRNCELCRLAHAHLRSPHAIIRSRVAGWRRWSNR